MRHGKIDLQNLAVGDLLRIERHLHRLGVPGALGADHLVVRGFLGAAGIARDRAGDALGVLKHRLHAPEAAAGENDGLRRGAGRRGGILRRRRDGDGRLLRDAKFAAVNSPQSREPGSKAAHRQSSTCWKPLSSSRLARCRRRISRWRLYGNRRNTRQSQLARRSIVTCSRPRVLRAHAPRACRTELCLAERGHMNR